MRTRIWTIPFGAALVLALAVPGYAVIERNAMGGVETIECNGESVEVNGTGYDLTLLGECRTVEVNGMSNTVRVEIVRSIEVTGTDNKVIWERGARAGRAPAIENTGIGNSVRQGTVRGARSGRAHSDSVTVTGSGESLTVETKERRHGDSVTIAGAGESLTVDTSHRGRGESVTIESGTGESLSVETKERRHGDSVTVAGAGESLTVETGRQRHGDSVVISGEEAAASSGAGRTSAASGDAIVVNGNNRSLRFQCNGRDAEINGNNNVVTLNGECSKVNVAGNHNVVRIEAAVAIEVLGNYDKVTWSHGVDGRRPRVSNLGNHNSISQAAD